jgi:3'(2'), 5'-bisphosphate nucleotidase
MHALVESAGGQVMTVTGAPLTYDRISLTNPDFVVLGKGDIPWREIVAAL